MTTTDLYSEALLKFNQAVLDRHKDTDTRRLLKNFLLDGKSNYSTPDSARQAAAALATDAGEKYNGIKVGKVEVVPKKWVDRVLGNIDNIIVAGDTAVKHAPESVGMAWFAISLTLKAISNNYSLYALFGKGLTDITEVMIIIVHYDRLYDERQKSGTKVSAMLDKLFRDTVAAYAAVLDFSFSVKKHMSGGAIDKLKHSFKDFFNAQASKFQAKLTDIASLKAKILEGSQAVFQDKTMQQFEGVQVVLGQLQHGQLQVLELQQEQNRVLTAMFEDFKDLKDLMKRKTAWDFLKDEFLMNKKKLAPLPDPHQEIDKLLTIKHDDTCAWILADEKYRSWISHDKSAILCILGGPGSGKSVLLASLLQHLGETRDADGRFVSYVSCSTDDNSQATALGELKLSRICNTILYQIYELATTDSDRISLLETCNQVFRNPKSQKAGQTSDRGPQSDGLPDFVDAMGKLVSILDHETIIVIDAVSALSQDDQIELYNNLHQIMGDSRMRRVSVLISSRSDGVFIQRSLNTTPCIEVTNGSKSDREAVLDFRLKELPGWLEGERQLARSTVLAKAGPRFSYIDDVAMPFLKQPFQRPVSNHLRKLPEGLNESFEHAVHSMPQNLFELLQLAVTWCILAPTRMTVKEVVEAYSRVYTVTEDSEILSSMSITESAYDPRASDLETQQVIQAGGPFLTTERTDDGQIVVKLQDADQVRKFCDYSTETHPVHNDRVSQVCDNCKSAMVTRSSLAIDPKVAHFEIALTLLRHLNSPLFQRRFGLFKEIRTSDTKEGPREHTGDESTRLAPRQDTEDESTVTLASDNLGASEVPEECSKSSVVAEATDLDTLTSSSIEQLEAGAVQEPNDQYEGHDGEDSDAYSESSVDEEPNSNDVLGGSMYDMNWAAAKLTLYDRTPELRCEINNWPYHLREAEKLWPLQERETSETWNQWNRDVQEELKKFVKNEEVFYAWQRAWGRKRNKFLARGLKPLHVAACLGLGSWVESLLNDGTDINELCLGRGAAQASASLAHFHENVDLLRLLLTRGANFHEASDQDGLPGLHLWLINHNTPQIVKAFVDHGVDFDAKDRDGWTGLHTFAWTSTHVESFISIMSPKDASKRPNINAVDNNLETPLHRLMWRRDVPLDLLQAFLAVEGIDVNSDDSDSQQPLAVASYWGSLDVVKLLLEANADVKDRDKRGCTAMHSAAQGNSVECLEALLDAHSELESTDKGGSTPLQHAAYGGSRAAVELLLSRGSDLNATNNRNRTAFFNATRCVSGDHQTALFLLHKLREGGYSARDINKITKGGRSPLRQASAYGFVEVVKDLLECIDTSNDAVVKATINQGDEKLGQTPLHCAVHRGHSDCVRLLLEHGADATLQDGEGKIPRVIAQEQWTQRNVGSFEGILLQLIDHDQAAAIADPELPSVAAARGSVQVLQKLYNLRADLNRIDSLGWSPLAHAKHLGHKDVEFFLKHQSFWGGTLPSRWVDRSSPPILDEHGLQVTYTTDVRICIVSDRPLPPNVERFYFEVTLRSLEGHSRVAIGFCTLGASAHMFPGWTAKETASFATSWGYHGDDGGHFHQNGKHPLTYVHEKYGVGDTVGCGVDLETHKMWFTKNGIKLDYEFENVRGRLYPILGMSDPLTLTTNFGQTGFRWKSKQLQVGSGEPDQ